MRQSWAFGRFIIFGLTLQRAVGAQSVPLDAVETPAPTPAASAQPAPTPPAPEALTLPQVLSAEVPYPSNGRGEHAVVLELTVAVDGSVTAAVVVSGESPFAEAARDAAQGFRFVPARRGGVAIAARIRFQVRFLPPLEPESAPEASAAIPPAETKSTAPTNPPPARVTAPLEVTVQGEHLPTAQRLGRAEVRELPGAFGDPFRAIEALPGVVPIASGVPYFYVRGAPPGNVGYFFDGIPVPLLYHFAAGPGVLHPAFVDHVDLYPGAYPARYGRFAGGIVAGELAPPNYEFRGEASVRLVDSGAMIEAPFADNAGSVMLGGRFSYTGLLLSWLVPEVTLNYWDYQGRVNYALNSNDSVEALFFGSGDFLARNHIFESNPSQNFQETLANISFHRVDLRWDRRWSRSRLRSAVMVGIDRTGTGDGPGALTLLNKLAGARAEYHHGFDAGLEFDAGADVLVESFHQQFDDGRSLGVNEDFDDENASFGVSADRLDVTFGAYGQLQKQVTRAISVTAGLRSDWFVSGNDLAVGVDPRLNARFALTKQLSAVHGLGVTHQSPSLAVPIPGLKPTLRGGLQRSLQHSAGVEQKLPGGFQGSLTLFHNVFFNMTDLLGLARLSDSANEDLDFRSTGHAYGAEVMLRRSLTSKLGGFASYTLSRSERSSGTLAGPATTDRAHVLNVAASYDLGRNWRLGGRAMIYSGIPASVAYVEAAKNPPRTPAFWRLDVRLQKRWYIQAPKLWWGLVFEVLNTTANKEVLETSCHAYRCADEEIGPVTIPSIGAEAAF